MADGPVAEVLLRRLEAADGGLDSAELATELGVEHQTVVGAVKSLQALGQIIETELRPPSAGNLLLRVRRLPRRAATRPGCFAASPRGPAPERAHATAQWQGGLQQGDVQQVDPGGQECC